MSGFTASCRAQALGAWNAAGSWPERYGAWKHGPSAGGRAQRGCLGFLIFGIAYIVVPMLILVCVETVLVGYALIASALWGVGSMVDGATGRRRAGT